MENLTRDELRRIHQTIRRSYPPDPKSNILAVGFGGARRDGSRDPARPFAACCYVRQKKERLPASQRIPPQLRVRLRRRNHFVTLTIPTDVVETPRFVPSGQYVTYNGGVWLGSAGVVVAWKLANPAWNWGVVTAGHLFRDSGNNVAIQRTPPGLPGLAFAMMVLSRSGVNELSDSAIIGVTRELLLASAINVPALPPAASYWRGDELAQALRVAEQSGVRLAGTSLRPQGDAPNFETERYFPQSDNLIPDLGNLRDIVQVRTISAGAPPAFVAGTSGSAWKINSRPAAVQVGHDLATSTEGLGQFLDAQLSWVRGQLVTLFGPSQDFRFVCTF